MTPDTFSARVTSLIDAGHDMPVDERVIAVNDLIEEYVQATGDVPPSRELIRLADFLDEKALRSNNKRHYDRPVYTDEQLERNDRHAGTPVDLDAATNVTYSETQVAREYAAEVAYNSVEQRILRAIKSDPEASNRDIARRVGVSDKTVAKYR